MPPILLLALFAWQQPPVFETEANLVPVEVQVFSPDSGVPIAGLKRSDFEILDQGAPRDIAVFDGDYLPLNLLLLIDVSGGFTNEGVLFTTNALLRLVERDDRVALMSFADGKANLRAPFTRSEPAIQGALREIFDVHRNNGRREVKTSRLLDAVRAATAEFENAEAGRRPAIVVLTHNREARSGAKPPAVERELLESSITLDAITIPQETISQRRTVRFRFPGGSSDPNPAPPPREYLEDLHSIEPLATATGGQTIRLDYQNARRAANPSATGREWNVTSIAEDLEERLMLPLRARYVLGFYSARTPQPEFHRLEVRLTGEARRRYPNATVRTRVGYYTAANEKQANEKQ